MPGIDEHNLISNSALSNTLLYVRRDIYECPSGGDGTSK